ncbi:glycosyltransferase family 1 protein, partial [Aerosakkonemataceae cyanobacterium BLCC-F50]
MRILSIHNNYQIRGGEDESRELEERLLLQMGHEVEVYQENNDRVPAINGVNLALRTVWSREAYNTVKQKLSDKAFD